MSVGRVRVAPPGFVQGYIMTDQTAQEPTMEEILASIRRIISEDDAPAETAQAATPEPEAEPEPAPAPIESAPPEPEPVEDPVFEEEDVLELTEPYEAPAAEVIGDLDVAEPDAFPAPAAEIEQPPEPEPAPQAEPAPAYNRIVGDSAAASAASAFAGLAAAMRPANPSEPSLGSGLTIDDLARALLRPMLKEWLDAHLPGIVEAEVRKEVERIARTAG
jgi:cell pole-organizing protein PopZ